MRKIMSTILMVTFVLAQSNMAGAYILDSKVGPYTASVNLSGGAAVAALAVAVKNIAGGTATDIGWTGVNLGDGWKKSGQYLEVAYIGNQIGWGVQVYTDNLHSTTVPYGGDPTSDPSQQPAGLIGQQNTLLTCPLAILVEDETLADAQLQIPLQDDPNDPGSHFISGYDKDGDPTTGHGTTGAEIAWFFLKDIGGTVWDRDPPIGNGDDVIDPGELNPSFNHPIGYFPGGAVDDYATIVETTGYSSGWVHVVTKLMQRVANLGDKDLIIAGTPPIPAYSLNLYLAANFSKANELQEYKTDTLTLEIYHE